MNKPDGGGTSAYHGYWPRDMMRIEEHFGDAANSWAAFDKLVAAAHASGIKVIVDFVANHTNDIGVGENGALYNNGVKVTDYTSDTGPTSYYNHTPNMTNFCTAIKRSPGRADRTTATPFPGAASEQST